MTARFDACKPDLVLT